MKKGLVLIMALLVAAVAFSQVAADENGAIVVHFPEEGDCFVGWPNASLDGTTLLHGDNGVQVITNEVAGRMTLQCNFTLDEQSDQYASFDEACADPFYSNFCQGGRVWVDYVSTADILPAGATCGAPLRDGTGDVPETTDWHFIMTRGGQGHLICQFDLN